MTSSIDYEGILREWTVKQTEMREKAIFKDDNEVIELVGVNDDNDKNQGDNDNDYDKPVRRRISINSKGSKGQLEVVGGIDVSFKPGGDGSEGIATLVVLAYPSLEILGSSSRYVKLEAPYIPSFLSLRESGPLVQLIEDTFSPTPKSNLIINNNDNINSNKNKVLPKPEIIFVDGNGRLHEREAGLATAIGVLSGYPTIGIGKDYHPLVLKEEHNDNVSNYSTHFRSTQKEFKKVCKTLLHDRGDWIGIYGCNKNSGFVGGALLSSPDTASKVPIFVSPGHRISLDSSLGLTFACCRHGRVPDPVRHADMISRQLAHDWPWP